MIIRGMRRASEYAELPEAAAFVLRIVQEAGYEFGVYDGYQTIKAWNVVPCRVLYDAYIRQPQRSQTRSGFDETLSRAQFGVALHTALPGLQTTQATVHNQDGTKSRQAVYVGVTGPNSFRRKMGRGRPRRD